MKYCLRNGTYNLMPYGMALSFDGSVANVVGLQYVPSPDATLWITGCAIALPGGVLSGQP
jgi:hypothetical protein